MNLSDVFFYTYNRIISLVLAIFVLLFSAQREIKCYILNVNGQLLSSEEFARFLQKKKNSGVPTIDFIIGGEWGISENIKQKANFVLSLSRLTFTHDLTRLVLLEQIYRAFTIMKGENYHR